MYVKILNKLATKYLTITQKKVRLKSAGSGKYLSKIYNDLFAVYDNQIYYLPLKGSILLGQQVPENDMSALIYQLFKRCETEGIDIYNKKNDMKIFGFLIELSNSEATFYYARKPEQLTKEEQKIYDKLRKSK